jgi:hypothetical protein
MGLKRSTKSLESEVSWNLNLGVGVWSLSLELEFGLEFGVGVWILF